MEEQEIVVNEQDAKMSGELNALIGFITEELSKELPVLVIDPNYFLLGALSHKKNDLYVRLETFLTSPALDSIYNTWYASVSSKALSAIKPNRTISFDDDMIKYLNMAKEEANNMGSEEFTSEHVLLAILSDADEKNKIRKVFNKAGLTYGILKGKIKTGHPINIQTIGNITLPDGSQGKIQMIGARSKEEAEEMIKKMAESNVGPSVEDMFGNPIFGPKKKMGKNAYISQFCTDLTKQAEEGKIERLIGREREVDEIIRVLGRKKKNNAILVGSEGVGKTAIGESLAWRIVHGAVPEFLSNKKLVSLDMTALMAGTTLRGMFEERVKGILDDIKKDKSFILFMDNIGAMFADKGKNDFEMAAMLARALENGDIQVIGTSDFASYRSTFDKDPSLARRFHKIIVEAPTIDESIDILYGLKKSYEEFHGVVYEDEAIRSCVMLANRYISERNLPDSAIDIMDEVGSLLGTSSEPEEIAQARQTIADMKASIATLKKEGKIEEADILTKECNKVNARYKAEKNKLKEERANNPITVNKDDILNIVAKKTGIPINSLTADDKKRLANMNERIKEGVIGQDDAIDTICRALKRNKVGFNKTGCMYSALMIGKSGVGKTLIAKKLAKELFGDEKALVRFDMSEYSDKVSVNKLIGSNPGYVGYEEGGQLTESIKNHKHCVLLLDEIEKADPEVYNIFLQVLDEGFLTDNSGMRVDFSNVIVLFTSNVGARAASEFGRGIGFGGEEEADENTKKILLKELKKRFPPEFINRIDSVIYFNSLTDDNLRDIIKIEMNKLKDNMASIGYDMEYDDKSVNYILTIVQTEKEYGARPILRAIRDEIEDKITDAILEDKFYEGHTFKVSCCEDMSSVVIA